MATLYNRDGIAIETGNGTSDFGVTDYDAFVDNDNVSARQAILTYQGKRLYPKNYPEQRIPNIKKYNGGVMIALGDSYTSMGASYFSAFAEKHGLVCDNRGLASSTIAGKEDNSVGYHPFWARLDRAIAEYQADGGYAIDGTAYTVDDVKLVTFMGGANDWSTVNETIDRLGKGATCTNKEQLYGALNYIFTTLLSTFKNADIVVILQPVNYGGTIPTTESDALAYGFESLEQVQAMTDVEFASYTVMRKEVIVKEMAERYGLPICDCCFEWYNPINPDDATTYWQSDKVHMTDAGNEAIFSKLEDTVNSLPFTRNS